MALKDDINVPLCVVVGMLVATLVAIAAIGTEAGYNYVDRHNTYERYEELAHKELLFAQPIKKTQSASIGDMTDPIAKLVANHGATPSTQPVR